MNKYNMQQFVKDLQELKINLSEHQMQQYIEYYELLVEWNSFMNLTAITEFDEVMKKHFIDSLSLVRICDMSENISLIDVGTGAGFPGLPLKIAFPQLEITLLDSLNKRIKFIDEVINRLGLKNIKAIHGRAEDYAKSPLYRGKYDVCVSRAVSNMTTLSEYCLPFVKTGGRFISYKSEKLAEEIQTADKAIDILGGQIEKQTDFTLPDSNIYRNLVLISKIKETPKKYPRKAGIPAKEPII